MAAMTGTHVFIYFISFSIIVYILEKNSYYTRVLIIISHVFKLYSENL